MKYTLKFDWFFFLPLSCSGMQGHEIWFNLLWLHTISFEFQKKKRTKQHVLLRILTKHRSIGCKQTIQWSCLHRLDLFDYNRSIVCCRSAKPARVKFLDFYRLAFFALPPYFLSKLLSQNETHTLTRTLCTLW